MTTTYAGAKAQMNKRVNDTWTAAINAVAVARRGTLRFQGNVAAVGTAEQYWGRVSMQTLSQEQSALGKVGPEQKKRHCAYGLLFVQMFFPTNESGSWDAGIALATAMKNALAGQFASGTVWLRNPRINELDPEGAHHRLNVVAEFEYDEVV